MELINIPATEQLCTCGYLEGSAANPNTPVRFDPDLNEYLIVYTIPDSGQGAMMLYHCPMCGGATPPSRRHELFAEVPPAEVDRLNALTSQIRFDGDVSKVLGVADTDEPFQIGGIVWPSYRDEPELPVRILDFTSLSKVANIQVTLFTDGRAHASVQPKYIGPPYRGV
jgi:hypothetical protein